MVESRSKETRSIIRVGTFPKLIDKNQAPGRGNLHDLAHLSEIDGKSAFISRHALLCRYSCQNPVCQPDCGLVRRYEASDMRKVRDDGSLF
jgi:hypothetical protein